MRGIKRNKVGASRPTQIHDRVVGQIDLKRLSGRDSERLDIHRGTFHSIIDVIEWSDCTGAIWAACSAVWDGDTNREGKQKIQQA